MSYLEFEKQELTNLEYSLQIEYLRSNRGGSFASSTIINCHTRKYHGLLICPLEELDGGNHVLLSALDETVIQHEKEFHLAVRKYPGVYHPGHKYIREFSADPVSTMTYRVGGVILKKEHLLVQEEEQLLIRYTLEDAHSPTTLRLHPFLAFRNVHTLSKENMDANMRGQAIEHGLKIKMYEAYPYLHMQVDKKCDYVAAPMWFKNIEYSKEQDRGYDYREDLMNPGYFEVNIKKGESVIFAAGLQLADLKVLSKRFEDQIASRIPRNNYSNCLKNASQQMIARRKNGDTEIISAFPWFGKWSRDTFISLPGLTLASGNVKTFKAVVETMLKRLNGCVFKDEPIQSHTYLAADAPLWFIWGLQQLQAFEPIDQIWKAYSEPVKAILSGYRDNQSPFIAMHENGLIQAGNDNLAVTWMDTLIHGHPVTPRNGYAVEINALWYNAVCFALQMAKAAGDKRFVSEWQNLPATITTSFQEHFWCPVRGYLADFVLGSYKDYSVRPNQLFATSLEFSMLTDEQANSVLEVIKAELLTPRGIRSLSPRNPNYKPNCSGLQVSRELSNHQGSAWPWLLGHFASAYLRLHERSGLSLVKKLFMEFEDEMIVHGIGTISELYDGNPPHEAHGAISYARSIAELIRIEKIIERYESKQP